MLILPRNVGIVKKENILKQPFSTGFLKEVVRVPGEIEIEKKRNLIC